LGQRRMPTQALCLSVPPAVSTSARTRARVIVGRVLVGEGKQDCGDPRDHVCPHNALSLRNSWADRGGTLFLYACCGSADLDLVVTALVLAASGASASTTSFGRTASSAVCHVGACGEEEVLVSDALRPRFRGTTRTPRGCSRNRPPGGA